MSMRVSPTFSASKTREFGISSCTEGLVVVLPAPWVPLIQTITARSYQQRSNAWRRRIRASPHIVRSCRIVRSILPMTVLPRRFLVERVSGMSRVQSEANPYVGDRGFVVPTVHHP